MNRVREDGSGDYDVAVIGGGLAGLVAAATVAKAGRSVVVLEKGRSLGGRAATQLKDGIHFNMGPHALYRNGDAYRILNELDVTFSGRFPSPGRGVVSLGGTLYRLPADLWTLLPSRLISVSEKMQFARMPAMLQRIDSREIDRVPLQSWIRDTFGKGHLALLMTGLFRLSTYAADAARMSAGAAVDQLKLALKGSVWYIDEGWQTLIEGLRKQAIASGAEIRTETAVASVRSNAEGVTIQTTGGDSLRSATAIVATAPETAVQLLGLSSSSSMARWARATVPIRAACLDVALRQLPVPNRRFALGLDQPYYFSVHSAAAQLGPKGVAVLHVAKYLSDDAQAVNGGIEVELEAFLDRLQRGWRGQVVARRYLPNMIVAHCLPSAEEGGLAGRPGVEIDGVPRVWLAGDWVGANGQLADAAAASGEEAAQQALAAVEKGDRHLTHPCF